MRAAIISFGAHAYYPHLLIQSILEQLEESAAFVPEQQLQEYQTIIGRQERVYFYKRPRLRNPLNIKTLRKLLQTIRDFNPEVIHLLSYYPWLSFFRKHLQEYPLVLTVHDPKKHTGDISSKIVPGSEQMFYKYASQIITLGQEMKKVIGHSTAVEESRITVIPHGNYFCYLRWAAQDISKEENCVLFFGRLYSYKGLEYLIEAAARISEAVPTAKFIIAGDGSLAYVRRIRKLISGRSQFVFHHLFIPDPLAARLFQEASLLVLPYVDASQSGPLLMAYAFKKPVVVTRVGSLPEYVDDGRSGYIVPPRDPISLAEKIIELLQNSKMRETMGLNGYQKSEKDFSWSSIGKKTIEVYQKAIAGS